VNLTRVSAWDGMVASAVRGSTIVPWYAGTWSSRQEWSRAAAAKPHLLENQQWVRR
jgi:hypothetical protein